MTAVSLRVVSDEVHLSAGAPMWVGDRRSAAGPASAAPREVSRRALPASAAAPVSWQESLGEALPPGAVVRSSVELDLDPEPRNVGLARRFVAGAVADAVPELSDDSTDTLLLLTSELVTNAVVHARTPLQVGVVVTDEHVVVAVHDLDLGRREQRTHERDGGRGLAIVRALAAGAGRLPHTGGGKTAWFRVDRVPDTAHPVGERPDPDPS